ncbi:MAG TPA: thiosulfate oxidation carrier complex protein SoxZ [Gammaproteobacteria bacterium]|jgi:sulfur-oxidizing protein SoxZ|nr:thiosulfate oxidation carrier complex protein SoxZ [Gammaproteobacteria bacterium]
MSTIKLKARVKPQYVEVKGLIKHVMETGVRRDDSGQLIPAHYIQEVKAYRNGELVWHAYWGPSISKDPYFSFRLRTGQAGDQIRVQWLDNRKQSDEAILELV